MAKRKIIVGKKKMMTGTDDRTRIYNRLSNRLTQSQRNLDFTYTSKTVDLDEISNEDDAEFTIIQNQRVIMEALKFLIDK